MPAAAAEDLSEESSGKYSDLLRQGTHFTWFSAKLNPKP